MEKTQTHRETKQRTEQEASGQECQQPPRPAGGGKALTPEAPEETGPCRRLDVGLLASRTVRQDISVISLPLSFGIWLRPHSGRLSFDP